MRFARAAYLSVLGRVEAVDYDVLAHSIRPALGGSSGLCLQSAGGEDSTGDSTRSHPWHRSQICHTVWCGLPRMMPP